MSKAFYKPGVQPKLLHSFSRGLKAVEIWITPCIVTRFGKTSKSACNILINPCNPQLSGVSKFAYFPKGGPVPKDSPKGMYAGWQPLGYVSSWGGMEVGQGMLYATSVVDGLVHQLGGWKLKLECAMIKPVEGDVKVPVGSCVATNTADKLANEYDTIIHTTPPFYKHFDKCPADYLKRCYKNSIREAFNHTISDEISRVAVPLLGAGGRGFPLDVAMDIAASESLKWCTDNQVECSPDKSSSACHQTLAFGIPETTHAEQLVDLLQIKDRL